MYAQTQGDINFKEISPFPNDAKQEKMFWGQNHLEMLMEQLNI